MVSVLNQCLIRFQNEQIPSISDFIFFTKISRIHMQNKKIMPIFLFLVLCFLFVVVFLFFAFEVFDKFFKHDTICLMQ